ncbi:MAG: hypothetical protein CMH54_04955 [Myxococcales bacterium]|nr:hypothetical protein [Myxococcales bacterium]
MKQWKTWAAIAVLAIGACKSSNDEADTSVNTNEDTNTTVAEQTIVDTPEESLLNTIDEVEQVTAEHDGSDGSLIMDMTDDAENVVYSVNIRLDDSGNVLFETKGDNNTSASILVEPGFAATDGHRVSKYTLQAEGKTLLVRLEGKIETISDENKDSLGDTIEKLTYMTETLEGTPTPSVGTVEMIDDTKYFVIVARDDSGDKSGDDLSTWLEETELSDLADSPALGRLFRLFTDTTVLDAAAQLQINAEAKKDKAASTDPTDSEFGEQDGAIHKSPICSGFLGGALTGATGVVCTACIASTPATTTGIGAVIPASACTACAWLLGISVVDLMACVISWLNAFEESDCYGGGEYCKEPWMDGALAADCHGCVCTCNEGKCDDYCSQQVQANSTLCQANCLNETCNCIIGRCGNGTVESVGECNEQCETDEDCVGNATCVNCQCLDNPIQQDTTTTQDTTISADIKTDDAVQDITGATQDIGVKTDTGTENPCVPSEWCNCNGICEDTEDSASCWSDCPISEIP